MVVTVIVISPQKTTSAACVVDLKDDPWSMQTERADRQQEARPSYSLRLRVKFFFGSAFIP